MPVQQYGPDSEPRSTDSSAAVDENGLVVRNYDGAETHDLWVRFVDPYGETVLDQTVSVAPQETAAVGTRLERAVYCVEVKMENGASASAECLIGSGPGECAMVETGNGRVSVVEGAF